MKKNSFLLISTLILIFTTTVYAKKIESVVIIKPEIKYSENLKYEKIEDSMSYEEKQKKKDFDFGINIDINKEERTIDLLKIDVQTNF